MTHRIQEVKPIENSILLVEFQNGVEKTYDVKELYSCLPQFKVFETDLFLFNSVKVDTGGYGISWSDELDLDAEEIWENGKATGRIKSIDLLMETGINLMKAREKMGITQKELAERTGIYQADISKIERGIANPSLKVLNRLADGMNMKLNLTFVSIRENEEIK